MERDMSVVYHAVYIGVHESENIQLGYYDPDLGKTVKGGKIALKKGEVYRFVLKMREAEEDIYEYVDDNGNRLYSSLSSFLTNRNMFVFTDEEIIKKAINYDKRVGEICLRVGLM